MRWGLFLCFALNPQNSFGEPEKSVQLTASSKKISQGNFGRANLKE